MPSVQRVVNDIFYRYDHNRDGAIKHTRNFDDKNLLGKVAETFSLETEAVSERVFDEERTYTYNALRGQGSLFKRADRDGDGSTTVEELTRHISFMFDEDQDGQLSSRNLVGRVINKIRGADSGPGELQKFRQIYPERVASRRDLSPDRDDD